ncbi:MAG: GTPase ObgE [Candidatus Liptonbacteria bacterium]|nr:GTPase ObgE [Candidatus Liptonbacteria bacterium]
MLIDDVTIRIKAGNGGNGGVAFNKNMMSLGPTGASGGNGGNVYAEGVSDLGALRQFRFKKAFAAPDGKPGRSQFRDGQDGEDLILKVPAGTTIHNLKNEIQVEILKIGEKMLLAEGGKGGRGNFHFRSSTNTSPKEFEYGTPGEEFEIRLELKLIADIGLIGFPNAGKSSLLNALTNAKSKIGNYPFTTLEPNLGAYYELILADIPGLIEGSSGGKGLGIKFLRHIERTGILFHLVSGESMDPEKDYKTIRQELGNYSKALKNKPEYLFLSKIDLLEKKESNEKLEILRRLNPNAALLSIKMPETLENLKQILNKIKTEKGSSS